MAFNLPNATISPIPDTEPDAVPALWNFRYDEIDANFARIAGFIPAGVCTTGAAVAAKTVECEHFVLAPKSLMTVQFTVTNTAENPTLDINSTGAKPIRFRGAAIRANLLKAGYAYSFVYDGTAWCLVGDVDTSDDCLKLSGGTITGNLAVEGELTAKNPTKPQHVVTKTYFESALDDLKSDAGGTYLKQAGGTITGGLTVNGETIVQTPVNDQNPVTKAYFEQMLTEFGNSYAIGDMKNTVDGVYQAFKEFNKAQGIS